MDQSCAMIVICIFLPLRNPRQFHSKGSRDGVLYRIGLTDNVFMMPSVPQEGDLQRARVDLLLSVSNDKRVMWLIAKISLQGGDWNDHVHAAVLYLTTRCPRISRLCSRHPS